VLNYLLVFLGQPLLVSEVAIKVKCYFFFLRSLGPSLILVLRFRLFNNLSFLEIIEAIVFIGREGVFALLGVRGG